MIDPMIGVAVLITTRTLSPALPPPTPSKPRVAPPGPRTARPAPPAERRPESVIIATAYGYASRGG
eukprot:6773217-Prymnesium_polylepis.1